MWNTSTQLSTTRQENLKDSFEDSGNLLLFSRKLLEEISNDERGCEFVCDFLLLPPLHLGEIHSHQSVGHGLLVQVTAVPSDEGWHVITWEREEENGKTLVVHFMYCDTATIDLYYLQLSICFTHVVHICIYMEKKVINHTKVPVTLCEYFFFYLMPFQANPAHLVLENVTVKY